MRLFSVKTMASDNTFTELKLELPHGPWQDLFQGKWSGYQVNVLQNPDLLTLVAVFDEEAGVKKGVVLQLTKHYVAEGDMTRLKNALSGYVNVIEKAFPVFKAKYLAISPGPTYSLINQDQLVDKFEENLKLLEEMNEKTTSLSKGFGVTLTDLKYADKVFANRLFSDPLSFQALAAAREESTGLKEALPLAKILLGKKTTGKNAEENLQSLLSTVVIASSDDQKTCFRVLMENCVLNGVTAVVLDDDSSFEKMSNPNKQFAFEEYPDLQPIGMPVKNLEPDRIGIDLNLLDKPAARQVLMIPETSGEYVGKTAAELVDRVLSENKGALNSLDDVQNKLLTLPEETKKFHVYRASRFLKLLEKAFPGLFKGKPDLKVLVSPYVRSMGTIVRINVSGLPDTEKQALLFSIATSLAENYKYSSATREIRVLIVARNAERFAPSATQHALQSEINNVLSEAVNYGVGFIFGVQHELDLNQELAAKATIKLEFLNNQEVAVQEINSRPYRMQVRPPLSA